MSVLPPLPLDDAALALLRSRVRGRVVAPGDAGWAEASTPWNVAVHQSPAAVVEVADVTDVEEVVRWAAEHGRTVSAQPRGHGATPAVDGTILLRTGALHEIAVDAEGRRARVGAGVRWGELLPALDGTGLVALAGSNPDVTVVGYHLGGGLSWFGRRHGYAVHSLLGAEVVDASGHLRWVTDESDPDLMWALRGGGGDLAVVTSVEIALHPHPTLVGGKVMFPIGDARAVLRAFLAVSRTAPRELTLWASLMHFPPVEFLPEPIRGKSFVTVDATYLGDPAVAAELLDPIRAAGTVVSDTVAPIPVGRLGEVAAEPTDPTPGIDGSELLARLDEDVLDRILAVAGDGSRTALVSVQIRHLGGALPDGETGPAGAAAAGIPEPYLLWALGIAMDPGLVEPIRASLAAVLEAPGDAATGRTVLTLLAPGEPLTRVFDGPTLARLGALKVARDPEGIFRGNHPLPLAGS